MLDQLEKEAVLELQRSAGLLAERTHLLNDRTEEGVREWRERLRVAGSALGGLAAAS